MEFGKHLGKGLWAMADKALPVIYGIAYVVLVIRVLPEEEFGNFVLIQDIFLIASGLVGAFALQPLLKFASESDVDLHSSVTAALLLNLVSVVVISILSVLVSGPVSTVLSSPGLASLMMYLPALMVASFIRNFTLILLQARFRIQEVFWTDAAHFLGAPLLIWIFSRLHIFGSALDLVVINIISLSTSSVIGFILSRHMIQLTLRPSHADLRKTWDYGKYSFGSTVSYLIYAKADTFILSATHGPIQVAVYNSVKVFIRVYDMLNQVIQMFVLPAVSKLSSAGDTRSLKAVLEKSILFSTITLVPVFIFFLFLPSIWVTILYKGRYVEAIPLLQILSLLSFVIPLTAVGANTLLGLGEARLSFILSLQVLAVSMASYLLLIPWLGGAGAAIGFIIISYATAWLTAVKVNRFVPLTLAGILRRRDDIKVFLASRLKRG